MTSYVGVYLFWGTIFLKIIYLFIPSTPRRQDIYTFLAFLAIVLDSGIVIPK